MSLYASGVVRIISDIEAKTFDSGSSVVKFRGGLNEGKDKNGEYIKNAIDCEAWGKTGEVITRFCENGSSFFASGRVVEQRWQDRESGGNRSKHVFTIDRVELLPRAGNAVDKGAPAAAPSSGGGSPFGDPDPIDDEIPFWREP